MGFKAKIDYCGLGDGQYLRLADHDEGKTNSVATCQNEDGDTVAAEAFGEVQSPTNAYELKADATNLSIPLGRVTTVNLGTTSNPVERHFALKSVKITTAQGTKVGITAQAEEVPESAARRTYTVTIPKLLVRHSAQKLCDLFTLGGENCHLQKADYVFEVDFDAPDVDGVRITHDVFNGRISCDLEAKQAGTAAPTVTAGTGAVIEAALSETRPNSDFAVSTATVAKYLEADPVV